MTPKLDPLVLQKARNYPGFHSNNLKPRQLCDIKLDGQSRKHVTLQKSELALTMLYFWLVDESMVVLNFYIAFPRPDLVPYSEIWSPKANILSQMDGFRSIDPDPSLWPIILFYGTLCYSIVRAVSLSYYAVTMLRKSLSVRSKSCMCVYRWVNQDFSGRRSISHHTLPRICQIFYRFAML